MAHEQKREQQRAQKRARGDSNPTFKWLTTVDKSAVMVFLSPADLIMLARTEKAARVPCAYALMDIRKKCSLMSLRNYDPQLFPDMGKHVRILMVSPVDIRSMYRLCECKYIVCKVMGAHLHARMVDLITHDHGLSPSCRILTRCGRWWRGAEDVDSTKWRCTDAGYYRVPYDSSPSN